MLVLFVLTVPMRNGNKMSKNQGTPWTHSVLTVPMRNGNLNLADHTWTEKGFLPYLWGMETFVFWGLFCFFKAFLPYLWGMETPTIPLICLVPLQRSYRTYEEWKLINTATGRILRQGSYRTYEEWKPLGNRLIIVPATEFLPYLWGMETY